jgi:hypothetical protein
MPKVIHPPVNEEILMHFMVESYALSGLPLEFKAITAAMTRKELHPYAVSGLNMVTHAIKIADSHNFPVRTPLDYATETNSNTNLYWLKELHEKIMRPIARAPQLRPDLDLPPYPLKECGVYRLLPKSILDGRPDKNLVQRAMPKPEHIPKLLHLWHKELCEFHQSYTKKFDNPNLLKANDIKLISDKADELHLQLICIKPFLKGNSRLARIVMNVVRLRWGLSWKTPKAHKRLDYVKEIMDYEDTDKWQNLLTLCNT